jgi:hypothetical protein
MLNTKKCVDEFGIEVSKSVEMSQYHVFHSSLALAVLNFQCWLGQLSSLVTTVTTCALLLVQIFL